MTVLDRFLGLAFALAYALRRSKIGFLRLHLAAIAAAVVAAAYVLYRGWVQGWELWHAAALLGCLAVVGLIAWAELRRYVVFRAKGQPATSPSLELAPEQKVLVRATGQFEVSNMRRYLAEVPGVFWTTQLADHVLAAKVRGLNVLGVGVPKQEKGWWYIFLAPAGVRDVVPGELCFGTQCRIAVRVQYDTDKGGEVVYISCNDLDQHQRLLSELRAKADAARTRQRPQSARPTA
jgi:hypothetical protein